jgi:ATP-binding cassette, subfamily B, multidrug efflux pump
VNSAQYHEEVALGKAYDGRLMKRLLRYVRPFVWMVVLATALLLVSSSLRVSMAFLTQIGIDDYIQTGDATGLGRIALAFLAVIFVILLASYGQQFLMQLLGQRVLHTIRMELYAKLQRLHLRFFDRNPVGRLVTRVTNDVNALNETFSSGVVAIIGDVVTLILIVAALLYYNWQLALITFLVLPALLVVSLVFKIKVRRAYRDVRTRLARTNAFTQEHISGMTVTQLFNQEQRTGQRFDEINSSLRQAHHRQIYYYAVFFPVVEVIGAVSLGLLLYYGGVRIYEGTLTFGGLVAFIQLVEQFYRPIRDLSEKYNILQNSMAASERIFDLLDTEPAIVDPPAPKRIEQFKGRIEFDHVHFAYNDEDWVLKDVTFTVEPGERVAIVGSTGAGKSSLVSLLFRFYDYQKGAIRLDGVRISDMRVRELRSHLGLVLQDVFLFSGDFAGNVRLRDDTIGDDQIRQALSRVGFDRFLKGLPDDLHTEVRERGSTLSTGQKQLLSFARALAFDPDILILDEATSSVDTETELLIQKALEELLKGRTSIVIAHRLSTIENADKIVVLHHGRVREIGTHTELLNKRGVYHTLYQMQYSRMPYEATRTARTP